MFNALIAVVVRVAALQVLLGWLFSVFSWLTAQAYLWVGLPATLVVAYVSLKGAQGPPMRLGVHFRKWWRHRQLLPLIFFLNLVLIVIGAVLYEPNNFDSLSYRISRQLFWLEQQRWYWIDTPYAPLNHTMPNYEWLSMPLFLLQGTRPMVLINLVSFVMVPPLWFVLLRYFGMSGRLAWGWMWILPSGYLVAMQAGGIGNDILGLTSLLAGLYFAIRFVEQGRARDMFDALLAAGFCTGVKVSNLPLAAFVVIVLAGNWKMMLARPRALVSGGVLGVSVSAAIPLALNYAHSGTILGTTVRMDMVDHPVAGWLGNGLMILGSSLVPPILPGANRLGELAERCLGTGMLGWIRDNYPKFTLKLNELPQEEVGGLGLGITLAVLAVLVLGRRRKRDDGTMAHRGAGGLNPLQMKVWFWYLIGTGLCLLAKLGTGEHAPRNLLPWVPVVLAPLLATRGWGGFTRSRGWKIIGLFAAAGVWPALMLTPSRPLVPPAAILALAEKLGVRGGALDRARLVYNLYQLRADPFARLRGEMPGGVRKFGLVSEGSEPTASWMRPYGARFPVYLRTAKEVAAARGAGIEFVVLKEPACRVFFNLSPDQWCDQFRATVVKTDQLTLTAKGAVEFRLVKLHP